MLRCCAQSLRETVALLRAALRQLETYWLAGARFLGGEQPCIADLVCAAEVSQLVLLAAAPRRAHPDADALLAPHAPLRAWLAAVAEATAPHWADAHAAVAALAAAGAVPERAPQPTPQPRL